MPRVACWGSRSDALAYVPTRIERLAERSLAIGGTADGWDDPTDSFTAGDRLIGLRAAFAELEAGSYPIPLPAGCVLLSQVNFDVFAAGRLFNGKVKTAA